MAAYSASTDHTAVFKGAYWYGEREGIGKGRNEKRGEEKGMGTNSSIQLWPQIIGNTVWCWMRSVLEQWLAVSRVKLTTHAISVQLPVVNIIFILPQSTLQLVDFTLHLTTQFTLHLLQHLQTTTSSLANHGKYCKSKHLYSTWDHAFTRC